MHYYLAVDQGTTGTTAILFDRKFQKVARGYCENKSYYPNRGWVEHDPEEMLLSLRSAVSQAMQNAGAAPEDIICIGMDHEGESALMWDADSGKALTPVIVWQDNRTADIAAELEAKYGDIIRQKTFLSPDSYFSATKLMWLKEHLPARHGRVYAGNMDAWMLYRLTGGSYATDLSTASRTMLIDLTKGEWDAELIQLFGLQDIALPPIHNSADVFGITDPDAFLGITAPVTALMCDQQAALLGQGCMKEGSVKTTYGTGCFMLMNTADKPVHSDSGLLTTAAWQLNDKMTYALDGGIYIAGAAIQWLRDGLRIIEKASQTQALAESLPDNGGVYFVPAFGGLGAPYRDPEAKAIMVGFTAAATSAHIVRATLESIAYQVADVLAAMEQDSGTKITELRCDGGATQNAFLMQFQADILGLDVLAADEPDATALGVALCAALGNGDITTADIADLPRTFTRYTPRLNKSERQKLMAGWHDAIRRATLK